MIKSQLVKQFSNPHGPLGHIAGRIMATRSTNVERNRWVVQLLDPAPDDQILEIGHGPDWPSRRSGRGSRPGRSTVSNSHH